ncbi:MAG: Asp-tRNA(Asn)/Glu-tRNA(Gln) amidotransferase GatCAB subunit A [Rhodobacteraceae bacterium]|nr:Asp-tRNA(Asn)/Glu-tRNA(Gln) amidotransferase GatCAB subunit A [Paracoccaceae bacterium]
MDHYTALTDVSAAVRAGQAAPVALTESLLTRIDAVNPTLNAYLSVTANTALQEAEEATAELASGRWRGPLHGVPIAIKDLFHTAGTPSTFGTTVYADFTANEDATIVRRLKQAGAIILGRLHLHEGAYGEHHPDLPPALNPWNTDYWPGGSSSGSGAATAAGLCYGSLGTDTGGSIRFPSAANGLTGLKPTWGRTSRNGAFPLADSLDTIGPMCRSAADAAAMLGVFAGADPADPTCLRAPVPDYLGALKGVAGLRGLKIGVDAAMLDITDAETRAAIDAAIEVFADLGAEIVPVTVPALNPATEAQLVICETECARFHAPAFADQPEAFGAALSGAITRGLEYDSLTVAGAYIEQDRFKGRLARLFEGIDLLVSPVTPLVGYRYDDFDTFMDNLMDSLGFTAPFNLSGSPTVTFPCGLSGAIGLPVAMQFIGPHLSEDTLLTAAHAYQQATDWHLKRPLA